MQNALVFTDIQPLKHDSVKFRELYLAMSLILSFKALAGNDLKERLTVPTMWLEENWPDENWREIDYARKIQLQVVHQVTMKCYEFVLSTRGGIHKKPVFECKGWKQFVKDNDLRVGDVVHFGKKEGENHYTIMVERKYV